jgi:tRNA modification GTPase
MHAADTIFALSSGAPPAAIAIIRISGPSAFQAVQLLCGRIPRPRRPSLANLYDPESRALLDQALLLLFPGPESATGEDLAELHLHGGRAVVRAVEMALAGISGLRQAMAGEFTRRAFLHGRMDLNEAEGLSDLLLAETEYQRRSAAQMMGGAFTKAIETWRQQLLGISALTEAELDFSDEDDVDDQSKSKITNACKELRDSIDTILARPKAEKLRDGIRVVLGGPPNSGKSSLLNALVSRDAAIVSDVAGTTRDVIEVPVAFDGIAMVLTDTAGVRQDSNDAIEQIGIERARNAFAGADIVLWLGPQNAGPDHHTMIEIDAKADLLSEPIKFGNCVQVSAHTGQGMTELISAIVAEAKNMLPPANSYAVNQRQYDLLLQARYALDEASAAQDWLIVGEQLRQARLSLDALTGRAHTEDLLDTVFGKFCIGK